MKSEFISRLRFLLIVILAIVTTLNISIAQESPVLQTSRTFLTQTMGLTVTNLVESQSLSYEPIGLPYKTVEADSFYIVRVSDDGSTVYGYTKKDMWIDEDVANKTQSDAISESEAFAAITDLSNYLQLPTIKSDYQMIFRDMGGNNSTDLEGCVWMISHEVNLNGMPCRMRGLRCFVSGASGAILGFNYAPPIHPDNVLNVVTTYVIARQTAISWLAGQPYFNSRTPTLTGDDNSGLQVIAPGKNLFDISMTEQSEPTTSFYCWEVPFSWIENEENYNGVVWVNVETGEVIGAAG